MPAIAVDQIASPLVGGNVLGTLLFDALQKLEVRFTATAWYMPFCRQSECAISEIVGDKMIRWKIRGALQCDRQTNVSIASRVGIV